MTHYTCHATCTDVPTVPAGATHRWATGEWTNPGPYGHATPIPKPCGMCFEARDRAHAEEVVGSWWRECAAGDRRFHDAVITGGGESWDWGGTGPSIELRIDERTGKSAIVEIETGRPWR